MSKAKYAPAARLDIKEIGRYTQRKWGRKQRNKYIRQLHNRANQLAEDPYIPNTSKIRGFQEKRTPAHLPEAPGVTAPTIGSSLV